MNKHEQLKKKHEQWKENAQYVQTAFGAFVDWHEGFYICPYCGEPVYEDDWAQEELAEWICPNCGDIDL